MAEMVAVRHESQGDETEPGLVPREFFDKYGKEKGLIEVKDEGAQAAAAAASQPQPPEAAEQSTTSRKGR